MRIAILGTRGVPNTYGGCEAAVEQLAPIFVKAGHGVTIYSPDEHPYQGHQWQGAQIKRIFNQESKLGIWGTLLYDFLCLKDAVAEEFDIIFEFGNVPCALFYPLFRRRRAKIVTNMDGLEWKRSKWNRLLQHFAKLTEKLGASYSDALIADNEAIGEYLLQEYARASTFIAYGAVPVSAADPALLTPYVTESSQYHMLIARMEPENNIEMIIGGFLAARTATELLVVGKTTTKYGRYLREKYHGAVGVRFIGGIYDYAVLSTLRWHSAVYFHGHSVGGTNPSLLEAMASHAFIAAHDNAFNRAVLGEHAVYFSSAADVARVLSADFSQVRAAWIEANLRKVTEIYSWERVAQQYLDLFERVLA